MHERPPNQCRACGVEFRGPARGDTPYRPTRPKYKPGFAGWLRWVVFGERAALTRWTCRFCAHSYDVED